MTAGGRTRLDEIGFVWKTPLRLRVDALILVVVVAAVIAAFTLAAVRFARPYPTRYDHAAWVNHPDWRRFMLNDLLTDKICPGTPANRVFELLGPADESIPSFSSAPPTLDWDVGTVDPLYIDFRVSPSGRKVVYSVLPDFWPPSGCWA